MNDEFLFDVEELYRGKWQPIIMDNDKPKKVRITEEQAEILNKQSQYHNIRYVKSVEESEGVDIEKLKDEYREVIGKEPHHKAKVESLQKAIAEAKG